MKQPRNLIKMILRNPLRLLSFFYSWIVGKWYVDQSTTKWPIIYETPGLGIRLRKHKTGRMIVHGHLIIERRGARSPYGPVDIEIYDGGTLEIHGDVILGADVHLLIGTHAKMVLGSRQDGRLTISHGSEIIANQYVELGAGCMLSWDVLVMDSNGHPITYPPTKIHEPIYIGENVWLGARCSVLKGVTLEQGVIIGTGSVVVKSVPACCAAAGNPAKVVKENVRWEE